MPEDEKIAGGRYEVNGRIVNANGEPLSKKEGESEVVVSSNGLQPLADQKELTDQTERDEFSASSTAAKAPVKK